MGEPEDLYGFSTPFRFLHRCNILRILEMRGKISRLFLLKRLIER
jgi:hypothetical protein